MPDLQIPLVWLAIVMGFAIVVVSFVADREKDRKGRISRTNFLRYISLLGVFALVAGVSMIISLLSSAEITTLNDWLLAILCGMGCTIVFPIIVVAIGVRHYGTWTIYARPKYTEKRDKVEEE